MVRVRMAPSPTGFVHLGSARTALYDYLYARKTGGQFVLRVEDTDAERNRPEYELGIYEGLRWLGLRWDEGPDIGGGHGPYRQSERSGLYRAAVERLLQDGKAYHCFCTKEELAREKEEAKEAGRTWRYSGRCRSNRPAGRSESVVRLSVSAGRTVAWEDMVRGPIEFLSQELDDFIIQRADGTPLYNFCVAVDDAEMAITHVLRGEEHISNTPKQLLVLEALGYRAPRYGHLPVILGPDGKKLSKRLHPEAALHLYQEQGYLPEALINYLALLGWHSGSERELYTLEELVEAFSVERVQSAPARFDQQKLDSMNGEYIRRLPLSELAERLRPFLSELQPELLLPAAAALQTRLSRLAQAREMLEYLWREPAAELDSESQEKVVAAIERLRDCEWSDDGIEAALEELACERGWSKTKLYSPLRLAVTGKKVSPPIHNTLQMLGRERALWRLERAAGPSHAL